MIRPHDKYAQPPSGPELRYVQEYATDADPDQPVQVKLLHWDGSAFVTYGTEFRIGDVDTATQIGSGAKFWITWRDDAQRWYPVSGGGAETYRLIRGQSVGAQSGGTLLIDNVIVLAGGLDPSGGNPATQVSVYNLFSQSYSDNAVIQAVYSEEVTAGVDWETLKTSGTETSRLIRGLVKGDVTADDATFVIDNVIPLGSGTDPVAGNAATEITLQNIQKEAFEDNTPITAIYDGSNWEVVLVERYRLVRGQAVGAVSGSGTFTIDNIVVLSSGVDPRSDPTSSAETLTITNSLQSISYADNAIVHAIYNAAGNVWEPLPISSGSGGTAKIGKADSAISARSGSTAASGTVSVWSISGTTLADTTVNETWYNISGQAITSGVFIQAKEIDGQMVIDFEDCA